MTTVDVSWQKRARKAESRVAELENLVRAAAPQIERSRTGYSLHDKQADEWLEWATSLSVLSPPSVREEPPLASYVNAAEAIQNFLHRTVGIPTIMEICEVLAQTAKEGKR